MIGLAVVLVVLFRGCYPEFTLVGKKVLVLIPTLTANDPRRSSFTSFYFNLAKPPTKVARTSVPRTAVAASISVS